MPIIPSRMPSESSWNKPWDEEKDGWIDPFFDLEEESQDEFLLDKARQAEEDLKKEWPEIKPSPEVLRRFGKFADFFLKPLENGRPSEKTPDKKEEKTPNPNLEKILAKLEGVRPSGNGWTALCPAHGDTHPSLSIGMGDQGRILLHCHAGCPFESIVSALGMRQADLAPSSQIPESSQKSGNSSEKLTNSEILLRRVVESCELWHTPDDLPCVTIFLAGHLEHWPLRSRGFRQWLGREFYGQTGRAIGSQALEDVLGVLEGMARFEGSTHPLFVRVGESKGNIYLDLGDENWRAVKITPSGWDVINIPGVRFKRPKGLAPLPVPVRGGSIEELRPFLNVSDEHWILVLAWLIGTLCPKGPFTLLKLLGEQGSGKTITSIVLRNLVDPNTAPVRSAPKGEHDLMINASNSWVVALDNLSWIGGDQSDVLCRLLSGATYATRTLYTNDEETLLTAQRPIILNGIEDVGFKSDLLDRTLVVELPRMESSQRRTESAFWRDFEAVRPRILGALLDAAVVALRNLPNIEESNAGNPRMADFAVWVVAAESALGIPPGRFLEIYEKNHAEARQTILESSPVVTALFEMLKRKGGTFEGTATELLSEISIAVDTRQKAWPKSAHALSGQLARLAPSLRDAGVTVEQYRANNRKLWRIVASDREVKSDYPTQLELEQAFARSQSSQSLPLNLRKSPPVPKPKPNPD